MVKYKAKLFSVVFLAVLVASSFMVLYHVPSVSAQSWTDIDSLPYTISVSGNYRLTMNVPNADASISIEADNVILDGQNHYIENNGAIQGYVIIGVYENITVENLEIRGNSNDAIDMTGATNVLVYNCSFSRNWNAIYIDSSINVTISESTFTTNVVGINVNYDSDQIFISSNSFYNLGFSTPQFWDMNGAIIINDNTVDGHITIVDNTFSFSFVALSLLGDEVVVRDNVFQDNAYTIFLGDSIQGLNLYNNFVNDTRYLDYIVLPPVSDLYFNTTQQSGLRIYGSGSLIGGNFWAHPDGSGWSQTHNSDSNGFVAPYDFFGDRTVYDYLPLGYGVSYIVPSPTPTVTSPPVIPVSDSMTLYFRSDTYQFNSTFTGYGLDTTNTHTPLNTTLTVNNIASIGFRIWLIHLRGNIEELTNGVPVAVVSRTEAGGGYQSAQWVSPGETMVLGFDRFLVEAYISADGGAWYAKGTYLSNHLLSRELYSATWNFTVYTYLTDSGDSVFSFGDSSSADSRIEGVSMATPLPQEVALYYGESGDFYTMVVYPYIYLIGNIAYSLIFLLVGGSFYLKTKRWETILVLIVLFGSFQGSMLLLPDVVYRIILIVIILICTVVLYRVFR